MPRDPRDVAHAIDEVAELPRDQLGAIDSLYRRIALSDPCARARPRTVRGTRSIASGVRPSVECFRRTDPSAPPAESLPAPKFFCKNVFYTKATPFMGRTIFGQVFVRGGMSKI